MKIGFHVGQVVVRGGHLQQQWLDHLEQFRACRDAGFDLVSWGHHWLIHPFQHFQPIPVLARLAAEAGTMDLATGVLLTPLLNPVQVAEDIATLDHLCQGRLIFGVGLGYRPEEFEAAGGAMSERVARFEEGLALMKRLWMDDEATHHGRFYRVTGARPTARPYQAPHPRIWIAATTEAPVLRAARLGHSFFAMGTLPHNDFRRRLDLWRGALAEHAMRRPADVPILREMYLARTRDEAWRLARPGVEEKYQGYARHGLPGVARTLAGGLDSIMLDPSSSAAPTTAWKRWTLPCAWRHARHRPPLLAAHDPGAGTPRSCPDLGQRCNGRRYNLGGVPRVHGAPVGRSPLRDRGAPTLSRLLRRDACAGPGPTFIHSRWRSWRWAVGWRWALVLDVCRFAFPPLFVVDRRAAAQ